MSTPPTDESITRARHITPALKRAGWNAWLQVHHEFPLQEGRVTVRRRRATCDTATVLSADDTLFFKPSIPLAVVEAKHLGKSIGTGMPQAAEYASLLGVPPAFSSNGQGFIFRDETLTDGVLEKHIAMHELPSPQRLWDRYCA
ncbi:MAG: hypothetical protein WCK08_14375 [Betaproteobacteria bacterium]